MKEARGPLKVFLQGQRISISEPTTCIDRAFSNSHTLITSLFGLSVA